MNEPGNCNRDTRLALSFRLMGVNDLGSVLLIENEAHSHPWSRQNFQDSLQAGHECWVAEFEKQITAYAIASCGGGDAELLNIAVARSMRREGIGRTLLEFVITQVESNSETLFLEVRSSNASAIELYHNLGFNEVGVRSNYYPGKKHREDALILAKPLL